MSDNKYEDLSRRFNQFIQNISLTSRQDQDARTKIDGVYRKLYSVYYKDQPFDYSKLLIFGSYAKGTNIRPARDVDILFELPGNTYKTGESYNFQSYTLQRVKNILLTKYNRSDIRGDGPVVVVNFENHHFVEVLPAYRLTNGQYYIPYTRNGGEWKINDPKAEINNIAKSDQLTRGNTTNLIKMMKKWQAVCSVPLKTLALERRVVNFLASYENRDKTVVYYDWMIRDFLKELIDKANYTSKLPGLEEKVSYGDAWLSKAQSAYSRAQKACTYEDNGNHTLATDEWKKIFGDDFWY